jgi:hypothetical protein
MCRALSGLIYLLVDDSRGFALGYHRLAFQANELHYS